jgi:hypothetical protein
MCNCTVPGAIAAISAATHGGFCWSSSQSPPCVFLCRKSGYLSFVYNQKSQSKLRSAMYSPHPRYHKNRESCTDLLHQHIAFTYFLLSSQVYYYYYPTSAKDMKEFLPNFRPWQDSNKINTNKSSVDVL